MIIRLLAIALALATVLASVSIVSADHPWALWGIATSYEKGGAIVWDDAWG